MVDLNINTKKVSVIVPCYNAERYINRCVDSFLKQTLDFSQIELIFVDDASTDGTLEVLLEIEAKYPDNTIVIPCEQNQRQGTARNIGLTYAGGEYIFFADADDWVEPDMLERMIAAGEKHDCEVIACRFLRDDGTGIPKRETDKNHLLSFASNQERSDKIVSKSLSGSMFLCRRDFLVENNVYFAENIFYEDVFWLCMLYVCVNKAYVMEEELYHYFINPESTVLKKNETRHLELLDIGLLIWREYEERGVLPLYRDALEMEFIRVFYFMGLKMLAQRFDHPPYEVFLYMQQTMKEKVPHWRNNSYVQNNVIPFFQILLGLVEKNVSEEDFLDIIDMMREANF